MRIAVYLGSSFGNDPVFREDARQLGEWIGRKKHTLVYGGAGVGTMGILAAAARKEGGTVIGVMPRFMVDAGKDYDDLSRMIVTKNMSERKRTMMELSDCRIALPGGPGTLEEVSEVISSLRLHLITGNCYLLNRNGFYDPLQQQLDRMTAAGFVQGEEIHHVFFMETVEEIETGIEHA